MSANKHPDEKSHLLDSEIVTDYSTSNEVTNGSENVIPLPSSVVLEPPNLKRSRWRSIHVMYFTMFLSSVTFTMTMSTLWPYLKVVDEKATPSFLGWVVASYSLAQLMASPFFGYWSQKRQAREPLICSLILQVGANVYYGYVQSIPGNGGTYIVLARAFMGFASGNAAVVRAYVSGATTRSERTSAMANVSLFQSVGFIIGPFIQTALVEVAYPGPVEKVYFHFNMYTSPAFLAALMAVINFILIIAVFRLHRVLDSTDAVIAIDVEDDSDHSTEESLQEDGKRGSPDYVAVFSSMYLFFIVFFMFTIFETIGTPLGMDMYGWSKKQAALYLGIMLAVAGVVAICVFIVVKILSKKGVDERKLLLSGYIFCFMGFISYLPWGHDLPPVSYAPLYTPMKPNVTTPSLLLSNESGKFLLGTPGSTTALPLVTRTLVGNLTTPTEGNLTTPMTSLTTVVPAGCPWSFGWCAKDPRVRLWQFILGTFFIAVGYPICNAMTYSIYSKVLGPSPQGLWMGIITACGSLARTLGPIFVAQVYDSAGPRVTFSSSSGILLITIIFNCVLYRRLVPFEDSRNRIESSINA